MKLTKLWLDEGPLKEQFRISLNPLIIWDVNLLMNHVA